MRYNTAMSNLRALYCISSSVIIFVIIHFSILIYYFCNDLCAWGVSQYECGLLQKHGEINVRMQ